MRVHQILKSKPIDDIFTIVPGTKVSAAAEIMAAKRIGAVIISKDGKRPDGILSERDIVRELGRRGTGCVTETVESMMTSKLYHCALEDSADDVLQQMSDHRFRHIPVMQDGEMVGLISIGDVVKARLMELSHENDALQGMIMGH